MAVSDIDDGRLKVASVVNDNLGKIAKAVTDEIGKGENIFEAVHSQGHSVQTPVQTN